MPDDKPPHDPHSPLTGLSSMDIMDQSFLARIVQDEDSRDLIARHLLDVRARLVAEVERRDRILAGVNIACTRLIRVPRWNTEIDEILRILGSASDSDRVLLFKFRADTHQRLFASLIYAWDSTGIDLVSNPLLQSFDLIERGFAALLEQLKAGHPVYYHRADRPPEKLIIKDNETSLNVPLFCRGELWGTLGFYTTRAAREWTAPELNALQIASDVLSAAIEREAMDEARQQSEERLHQAVHVARIGIWDWDLTTDRVEWNDEMLRIYGISHADFTGNGRDYIAFTREDYREQQINSINKSLQHGMTSAELLSGKAIDSEPLELCIVRADGTECFTLGDVVTIVDETGKPLRMLGVTLDITERKRAEAAMRERDRLQLALEKEQELNSIKIKFMRTLSHEFRTPLSAILSSATLLQNYIDRLTPAERIEKLDAIEAQVRHMNSLLDETTSVIYELLDYHEFQPRLCNLEVLCKTNFDEMRATLGSKHNMRFSSDGQLTSVFVDERLVHRILINLLGNALKYSPEQSDILLKLYADGDTAVIEVEDHGIGISRQEQDRLFEPFFRAANVGAVSGTGLGLSIVHDCIEQHRGHISVQSEIGRGTTITVRLPISPP